MSDTYKSITIPAGSSQYLPKDAIIIGISSTGDATAESECIDLNTTDTFECFEIQWVAEEDHGGGTGPWNMDDYPNNKIVSLNFDANSVAVDTSLRGGASIDGKPSMVYKIENAYGSVIKEGAIYIEFNSGERAHVFYVFKTLSKLGPKVNLKFQIDNDNALLTAFAVPSSRCVDPEAEA